MLRLHLAVAAIELCKHLLTLARCFTLVLAFGHEGPRRCFELDARGTRAMLFCVLAQLVLNALALALMPLP